MTTANEKRLIDANALKESVMKEIRHYWNEGEGGYYLAEDVIPDIDNAPSVDAVEVVHGRWEKVDHDGSWRVDRCSICHRRMHYVDYDQPYAYCPNCGAKMDGERRTDNV